MPGLSSKDRLRCQVRLVGSDGLLHGCGVICGPHHVLTCTHVVEDCLGTIATGSTVAARFPGDTGHRADLMVREFYPRQPLPGADDAAVRRRDICLLELAPGSAFPVERAIAPPYQGEVDEDLVFSGLGIGAFDDEEGETRIDAVNLRGRTGNYLDVSRIFAKAEDDDEAFRPGCSGTAAFAGAQGMIGLVVEQQQLLSGQIIPVATLREVWSFELGAPTASPLPAASTTPAEPLNRQLLAELDGFDREQQVVQFSLAFDRRWKGKRSGFVCAIAGIDDDLPPHCRDRIRGHLKPFFEKQGIKAAKILALEIGWPSAKSFGVDDRLAEMAGRLQLHAGADEPTARAIAAGLNTRLAPAIFYSTVDQRCWGKNHIQLLQRWSDFIADVSEEKLTKPLIHFVIVQLDKSKIELASDPPDGRLENFYRKLDADVNGDAALRRVERTDRLSGFDRDFVETWLEQVGVKLGWGEDELERVTQDAGTFLPEQASFRLERVEKWVRQVA